MTPSRGRRFNRRLVTNSIRPQLLFLLLLLASSFISHPSFHTTSAASIGAQRSPSPLQVPRDTPRGGTLRSNSSIHAHLSRYCHSAKVLRFPARSPPLSHSEPFQIQSPPHSADGGNESAQFAESATASANAASGDGGAASPQPVSSPPAGPFPSAPISVTKQRRSASPFPARRVLLGAAVPSEGGSPTPPAGNEAQLLPANEIISVCRSGAPSIITIAPDWNGQTWRGWGTSLAWFGNYVGKLPDDQFTLIMDLLFDKEKGVGLNLARYLIGGSFNATNSPQFLTAAWETRALPGFRQQRTGPYDWTADGRQRRTMLAALERNVDEVEAVSYSPPWWMTVSGDTAGTEKDKCNLKPEFFQAYTEYQAAVIEHYRTVWNVTFTTMNPANEALEGWWVKGARQEGCNFSPQQLSTLIKLLSATLQKRRLPTKVAGFDSFAGATIRFTYNFPVAVKSSLKRFNVHGYVPPPSNTTDTRRYMESVFVGMHRVAIGLDKEVWVSEYGPMWVSGNDIGVTLFMARCIVQSVNILGASAWIFWQAVGGVAAIPDTSLLKWCLLAVQIYRLNDTESRPVNLLVSKKLYLMQQLVRGAPRGSLPLQIATSDGCQHCITAFYNPEQHFISVFIINQASATHTATFPVEAFARADGGKACVVEMFRTSATEDNARVDSQELSDVPAELQVVALGSSITSLVLWNVDPI